jgi:hypothetical protein
MNDKTPSRKSPRRWVRRSLLSFGLVALLAAVAPWIVANTPLRDLLISRIIDDQDLRVSTASASFGWFSPLRLDGVDVARDNPQVMIRVDQVQFERTWLATSWALPDLGRVVVDAPKIKIVIPDGTVEMPAQKPRKPILGTFVARDVSFQAALPDDPDPVIAVNGLDVLARIGQTAQGRVLTIEPLKILDEMVLSPELCNHGLQLVAPILARNASVNGSVSLELTHISIPLDSSGAGIVGEDAEVRGKLQLHQVTTSLKDSVFRDVVVVAMQMLQVDLPGALRIADDTEVTFHLRDGRVHSEGLTFLLPELSSELVWKTYGSVGLDETLDLTVEAQLPVSLAGENEMLRRFLSKPFELQIKGTLDDPDYQLPEDRQWLLSAAGLIGAAMPDDQSLGQTAMDLFEQFRNREASASGDGAAGMLDQMRERLKKRGERDEEEPRRPFRFRRRGQPPAEDERRISEGARR